MDTIIVKLECNVIQDFQKGLTCLTGMVGVIQKIRVNVEVETCLGANSVFLKV